jgi:hypothetical protein
MGTLISAKLVIDGPSAGLVQNELVDGVPTRLPIAVHQSMPYMLRLLATINSSRLLSPAHDKVKQASPLNV